VGWGGGGGGGGGAGREGVGEAGTGRDGVYEAGVGGCFGWGDEGGEKSGGGIVGGRVLADAEKRGGGRGQCGKEESLPGRGLAGQDGWTCAGQEQRDQQQLSHRRMFGI